MTNYSTISEQLWSLPVKELHRVKASIGEIIESKIKSSISDIIESKIKTSLYVDQEVYVVTKNKKEEGVIKKVNKTRAVVDILGKPHQYNVPFSMIEVKN